MADDRVTVEETEVVRTTEVIADSEAGPEVAALPPAAVGTETTTYRVARGAWDFTDAQRIILAILLWLNLMVIFVGYLVLTGKLQV